ncbi:hypothetical protein DSO57_1011227 [Entomophthora muscae]|uniref:Uncharacterized protein n=1 Tax=Entomophthora muscae TaxID=34485 RepID=A0ACC2S8D7_9FUNG|nr:hypothetical protein DSO57_1011227 [Entomophthora muscae]
MITKLKEQMESEPDETKKKRFQTDILKLIYPTFWKNIKATSANFDRIRKRSPPKEKLKPIRDWRSEESDVFIPLPDLIELLSSKLVGATQRAPTWRVLNRAYRTDDHCGPSYPYKGYTLCGASTAGVTHRAIWKEIYRSLDIETKLWDHPGQDLLFYNSLYRVPPATQGYPLSLCCMADPYHQESQSYPKQTWNPLLSCLGFKALVNKTLERISKFGKIIPGGKRQIANLTISKSMLFHNYSTGQQALCWLTATILTKDELYFHKVLLVDTPHLTPIKQFDWFLKLAKQSKAPHSSCGLARVVGSNLIVTIFVPPTNHKFVYT